jgi:hypothetical protein
MHVTENPYKIVQVSAKRGDNVEEALEFIVQHREQDHDAEE